MLRFLTQRIFAALVLLLLLSIVTFVLIHARPGDYGDYIYSNMVARGMSPQDAQHMAENVRILYGLNDPLPTQYINWLIGIVTRFDFGFSFYYNRDVSGIIAERLPPTILLALTCHILASILGIFLGILAATRQYSWVDTLLSAVSFVGMTVPRFLLAIILLYILAFKLDGQNFGTFFSAQYGGAPWSWAKFVDLVQHVWPVIAIATFGGLAYNMRVMRANLLDTLNAQYIETARAKGLPESAVIMRHAVPNALHPLIAYQGVALPYMLTGEIEVAIVFSLATVGPAIVGSMASGDIYVTASFMLVLSATLMVGNIISDILLSIADPRIRLSGSANN
jgi:peptide/nickel transport system permease protein